jgi:FtsP/CotA-like multicopper oxidase with cupredoxin domain
MKKIGKIIPAVISSIIFFSLGIIVPDAGAVIPGVSVTSGVPVSLAAKASQIYTGDGGSIRAWGYALGSGDMQYPAPTLIVNQGATVIIQLTNFLSVPVSIVFPGQESVSATGGNPGILTREAPADNGATTVTYSFTASRPGTFLYHSGTRPDLQVEMGLFGAIIVRPTLGANYAYNNVNTIFDHEYLFLLSEMDPEIHRLIEFGRIKEVDTTTFHPVLWFLNGRNLPDTMGAAADPFLPRQPYNSLPRTHPGERVLLRMIGAGRDLHPFHTHGNNHLVIARNARLLTSTPADPNAAPDLAVSHFSTAVAPGETADAIWSWTGEMLGWDIYGHTDPGGLGRTGAACTAAGVPLEANEYEPDHCKPFPVIFPNQLDLQDGQFWSGSPFLGTAGTLPPGEGGFNPNAGLFFMWHSHNEKELTNNNIFPGGMATMMIVEPPGITIP